MSEITGYLVGGVIVLIALLLLLRWFKPKQQFQNRKYTESFLSSDPSLWLQSQLDLANQKIDMAHHRLNDLEQSYSKKENGTNTQEVQSLKQKIMVLERQLVEWKQQNGKEDRNPWVESVAISKGR